MERLPATPVDTRPSSTGVRARSFVTLAAGLLLTAGLAAQAQNTAKPLTAPKPAPPKAAAPASTAPSVADIVEAVKAKVPEADIIESIRTARQPYTLTLAQRALLKNSGASDAIFGAMANPTGSGAATPAAPAASAPTAVAAAGGEPSTAFPPDLPDVPTQRKRMLIVLPFGYGTVTTWVNYWFGTNYNLGEGIQGLLKTRLGESPRIAVLERGANGQALLTEQDFNASNRVKQGTGAKIGGVTGADAALMGEIVIFGRDDTTKRKGVGSVIGGLFGPAAGALVTLNKEEKAVVGVTLRLVDAQTTETIVTAEARGESSRTSKDYGAIVGVKGSGASGGASVTSSNFQNTIIGEATSNAVKDLVRVLEEKMGQIPARPREIEGRVAALTATGPFLNVGGNSGVLRGDRFEILRVDSEIKDPVTGDVIGTNSVKLGELVVHTVQAMGASGQYGGQPLSEAHIKLKDKGYAARLISK